MRNEKKDEGDDPILSHLLKQLRPFQREAYDFCTKGITSKRQFSKTDGGDEIENDSIVFQPEFLGKGRILLADEMGLGKSITSLAIMAHYRTTDWPLLILCPASLRYTWPGEIEKFIPSLPPSSVYVVSGFDDADFFENEAKRRKIQIVIATYSLLQTRSAAARTLSQFKFQSVIVDESHNLKQKNSQRAKIALPLLQQAKRLVLLSGTPALARPVELWTQISTVAPGLFEKNYSQFTKRYCNARRGRFGWDVSGLSNANELHLKLRQIMVRRLKTDVLKELPPKQRSIARINIPNGEKRRECESLLKDLTETRQSIQDLVGEDADGANFEARKLLMQAYQASGVAKSPGVCEYLLEWLRGSGSQKVLVFAHHKGVMDAIEVAVAKEFKGTGHIRIDGAVNSQERAVRVRKFQTSPKVRVAVLSMTAAGVGLTLTAATTVLFAELHWTPGVLAQAEDRCHRIGQRNAVNVQYLVCQDPKLSVDSQLWGMLGRKTGTLGRVIDGNKNASMDAKVATSGTSQSAGGQSVQDELQSFFADASLGDTKSQNKAIPVAGTITSFFKKQQGSAMKESGSHTRCISSACKDTCTSDLAPVSQKIEWACETCTFHNSRLRPKSGWLQCSMCQTSYVEDQRRSPAVTPPSNVKGFSLEGRSLSASSHQLKYLGKTSSQSEPIVLDEYSDSGDEVDSSPTKKLWSTHQMHTVSATSSQENPIILDDETKCIKRLCKKRKAQPPVSEVVPLDDQENPSCSGVPHTNCSPPSFLSFSASRNSGRITIHYARTNESSLINYEVDQVVSEATASQLLEAKTNRTSKVELLQINFSPQPIYQTVLQNLNLSRLDASANRDILRSEIEQFVSSYLGLREVEKKAIRDSEQSFSPFQLKQAALRIMNSSAVQYSTTRYSGGAKEQAKKNMENGAADSTDLDILEGKLCAWCGGNLPAASTVGGVESTYCSRECSQQGRLKRGGVYASTRLREQVFALEGGVCNSCGVDAHALFTRISALHPAERLNALINASWKLPKTPKALERLLQNPKEGDFWEADHIIPVVEGGGSCDLKNLRTLCVPCHASETERLRWRLRQTGGANGANRGDKHQKDIRTMFFPAGRSMQTCRDRAKRPSNKENKGQKDIRTMFYPCSSMLTSEDRAKQPRREPL
eukprot:scaffold23625_cov137-Cylindrotheca_fusiformis.AAC.7